eukprot:m.375424 g.375424  ORF g.375424 m.375424 type:complete len:66 (+) comp20917_c0_seq14:1326-1523(+)
MGASTVATWSYLETRALEYGTPPPDITKSTEHTQKACGAQNMHHITRANHVLHQQDHTQFMFLDC